MYSELTKQLLQHHHYKAVDSSLNIIHELIETPDTSSKTAQNPINAADTSSKAAEHPTSPNLPAAPATETPLPTQPSKPAERATCTVCLTPIPPQAMHLVVNCCKNRICENCDYMRRRAVVDGRSEYPTCKRCN